MISCSLYDYIEIACMYHFSIKLTLENGDVINGTALDTFYNVGKEESMKLLCENGEQTVVLAKLVSMQALVKNPHFDVVEFRHKARKH